MPSKLCVSTWGWGGKFGEEFYSKGSRVALLIRIRGYANLTSGGLLTKFCGSLLTYDLSGMKYALLSR